MDETNQDELESENQVDGGETDEQETTENSEDTKNYKQIAEDQRKRAEKAEGDNKVLAEKLKTKPEAKPKPAEKSDGLTSMDVLVLTKANVHEDDIEEVINYAKYKGVDTKTALKDKTLQTILRDRSEQRTTAEATSTNSSRRGSGKPTNEQLLADAFQGKFTDDAEALAEARFAAKKSKK